MREEMSHLGDATDAATKRKSRKRWYIRNEDTLTVGEVSDLIAARESGDCGDMETPTKRVRAGRRCERCSEIGHNFRTCKVEIEDALDKTYLNSTT
jgi:hypothetical protein